MSSISIAAGGSRTLLTANGIRYVRTTGSDSNDGLTIGTAWATLTHAAIVLGGTLDFGGFQMIVDVGAGSFQGVGWRTIVGGGLLFLRGAGSTQTTLTNGPNDGVYNFGECFGSNVLTSVIVAADAIGLLDSTGGGGFLINAFCNFNLGNPLLFTLDLKYSSPGLATTALFAIQQSFINTGFGTFTIVQDGTVSSHSILTLEQSEMNDNVSWTLSGAANTYQQVALFAFTSGYTSFNASWTGSANGQRYGVFNNSQACGSSFPGQLTSTFFPGSSAGFTDPTSSYDGYPFAIAGAGDPTTNPTGATLYSLGNDAAWSVWRDTNTGFDYIGTNTGGHGGTLNKTKIGGISATITTAKLTPGGSNGSMTFVSGVLTAQVAAT